jgi:hypothetical protein
MPTEQEYYDATVRTKAAERKRAEQINVEKRNKTDIMWH